ncbi:SAM-dependent methyltransferase [Lactobacillus johnsonii]
MKKYQNKLNKLDKELNYLPLHEQVIAINNIIINLEKGKILQKSPNSLGFLPDSLDIMIENTGSREKAQEANNLLNNFRSFLSREYGIWSLPNLETAQLIKQEYNVKSSLEIMAGNAYWSKALSEVGIKAIASDSFAWAKSSTTGESPIFETENLAALSAIKKHPEVDLIICSWAPNFGEDDVNILNLYRQLDYQPVLLFIGEKFGATNSTTFWQEVKTTTNKKVNRSFRSFDFIDEKVFEIK